MFEALAFTLFGTTGVPNTPLFKEIYWKNHEITIFTDGTVVDSQTGQELHFKNSSPTWQEEDFFTQQAKYCEQDSITK